MYLDVATLTVAAGTVAFSSGVFLLVYWWQDRAAWSAFWWALGNCGTGVGTILLALQPVLSFYASNVAGPLILNCAAVFMFVAARLFNRRAVKVYRLAAGIAIWIGAIAVTQVYIREQFASALGAVVSAGLIAAAALQFWLGRSERLRGRLPMIFVVGCYAATVFLVSLQFATTGNYAPLPTLDPLGAIHFVGLAYALGSTMFLLMMLKGRTEEKYRSAALIDPLTGLLNRRAFLDRAQRTFDRCGKDRDPIALIAFDLDRFKRINDTFGHATGDAVLQLFAEVASTTLRRADTLARIGGEEFVALMPGAGDEVAVSIASRIGTAFQQAAEFVDGRKIEATVSAGIATTGGRACTVAELLDSADAALYQAKNTGRNRVVLAKADPDRSPVSNVVRIA